MKIERGYAQHVGSRQEQQDAGLLLSDDGRREQLVVVADGMGGHAGGSIASSQLAETAKRVWAEHKKSPLEPKRLLERIIREGHEAINRAGAEKGLTPRSTCAMLLIHDGAAHWAHVGDSRIYRLRDGQVMRLTRDHSVVQMLVDLGKVSEEEMGTHPDQNRLTQSLGGDASPLPDFGNDAIKTHDAFLVCSDGLWEMIPQSEMAATLAAKKLGDDGARHLAERAFDRAKPKSDNITVALLRVGGPPAGAADFDEAPTTRIPDAMRDAHRGTARARPGGRMRWGFAAATVVALGAAAAVVYVPRDAVKRDAATQPATVKDPPPATTPPPGEQPKPPESKQPDQPPPKPHAQPTPRDAPPGQQPGQQPGQPGQPGQPPQSPSQTPGPPGQAQPPERPTPGDNANRGGGPPSWARTRPPPSSQ
jgi:serine/threonine protein phosphatase PrpC